MLVLDWKSSDYCSFVIVAFPKLTAAVSSPNDDDEDEGRDHSRENGDDCDKVDVEILVNVIEQVTFLLARYSLIFLLA